MTTKVFSALKASEMVNKATRQCVVEPSYRIGQALYNLLPLELSRKAMDVVDHHIWYNSLDREYCVRYFYDHFVKEN